MIEMTRRLLRQKFGSIGILIGLGVLALMTAFQLAATGATSGLEAGGWLAVLVLAAGSVSKDASSGALQMILARPIRRAEYLFGRYGGILLAYAAYVTVTAALAATISPLLSGRSVFHAVPGASLSAGNLAVGAAAALMNAALFSAILLFFSTFLPGYADVLAYFLLSLLVALPSALARPLGKPWLSRVGGYARDNLLPRVAWTEVLRGENVFSVAMGQYALALAGYLTLAAVIFCRREFSYGQD